MNSNCFKTVFSQRHGALVAVGEHASSQGKANGAHGANGAASLGAQSFGFAHVMRHFMGAVTASFALVALAWAQPALNALPTGGQVAQGVVQFSQSAQQLNISQASDRAAVNWQSFDIGAAAKVNVVQPSAQSVLLNRVCGTAPSQIFGQLSANGRVILVNPNGMVFGRDGSVSASAFTGSTLNISDADFMAGNERYTRDGATGAIVNRGLIQAAPGGYVALLGASVSNEGRIVAPQGDVYLAAADAVTMPANAVALPIGQSGRIKLELSPASINAAVANQKGGTIVTEGGQVYLQAAAVNAALATIIQSGSIDTTGEQGGAVHVLADGGHIRVDGSIKANSTGTDDKGQKLAGGDIYIGRDKDTNVLAAIGDVRDATLESQGGFIETSGSYLATDRVKITAKDWLLDPTNIRIVTASTGLPATAQSPASGTPPETIFQDNTTPPQTSEVLEGTIQSAISTGTNVTIMTTNTGTQGAGVGNITVVNPLSLVNNNANSQATLKLIADNGIFVDANITGSGAGLVNIDMLAKGVLGGSGSSLPATDSSGIEFRNGASINTNGTIKLDGTNNNTNANSRGITFNSGSSIKADWFDIKGTANSLATGSHGVHMAGNNTFTSSSTTETSQINGIAKTNGSIPGTTNFTGITAATNINGNVTFDAGNGSMVVKGSNTNSQLGVRVSESGGATNIKTRGEVTLGALEDNSGFSMRIGSITAETGNLTIRGQVTGARKGVSIIDSSSLKTNTAGKNIDIVGRVNTANGQSAIGVEIGRFTPAPQFDSKGSINIEGTVTGAGLGSGVAFTESGWGSHTSVMKATGDITIRGNNRALATNTAQALSLVAGLDATAGGKITLQAETNNANANANAIQMSSRTAILDGVATPLAGNTTLKATGDVLIQANQGSIIMNSSPLVTTPTLISGKNITIDNTGAGMTVNGTANANGGSIDANGTITAGTGKATNVGVLIADGRAITATGNLNIAGASTGAVGINTNGVLTATNNVNLTGTSSGINANAHGVMLTGKVNSTAGAVNITGSSTASNGGAGAIIQATVDAKNNITLDGRSGNTKNVQGLVIQEAVTSVEGDITVTGQNMAANASPSLAITLLAGTTYGSVNTKADNKKITINANTLYINQGSSGSGASVNAGSTGKGTVHIKTLTAGNAIEIGAADTPSGTLSNQKLGIDQTELNRITAGNLVIGDITSAGKITVDAATTTLAQTGNITLQTGGNIAVNKALTIASNVDPLLSKTLTLNATGANSTITQASSDAGITADKVEFLGNNATVTLEPTGTTANSINKIGTIAGNVKSFALVNNSNLTVGAVNGTGGLTTTDDIKLTSTSATGTALTINNKIESTDGNVSLVARTSESATPVGAPDAAVKSRALVKGKNVTMDAQALSMSGRTLGYYGAGDGGKFTATNDLQLSGSSKNTGNGFYMYGGALSAGNALTITGTSTTQGVGFEKAGSGAPNIAVASANGTTITGTSIGLNDVTLTNAAGAVTFTATSGDISANTTNTLTQNGNGDVKLTTVGNGNITVPKIINNGTGNVVIAAGSDLQAGNGLGGQVQTVSGNTISQTNTTPGKTYIYSGSAANTGALGNLDSTLGALKIDGTAAQNADTNVAYNALSLGIAGSNAPAQVMFREALAVDSTVLAATTLGKTYGDSTTAASVVTTTLLAEAKAALKNNAANSGDNSTFTTGEANSNNRIVVSKAVVVDSLNNTPSLTNAEFSSAGFLKAKTGIYQFAGLTSDKYTVAPLTVGVNVNQRELSGSVSAVSTTYGTTAATGSVSVSGLIGDDLVATSVSDAVLTGTQFSTNGSLRVGTYTQIADVFVTGGKDSVNYKSGTASSTNYVVTPKEITATATAADKVYDGNTSATLVASGVGILAGDVVTVQGLTGNFASKNVARDGSGNVVAQDVLITGTGSSLGGTDGANYTLVGTTSVPAASARITPKDLSLAGITAADKVYDGTTTAQLSSANAVLTGLVAGDSVNVSAQNAQGNFVDKNVARGANGQPVAKQVLVSGLALTGADQGNYQLGSSADVSATITPRTVSLLGSRALDKVVDGTTTAQVLPGTLEGLVAGEQLGVNASGEFEDALVGTNKLVNARFALVNGSNGLASNYDLANTTAALRAAIVAFVPNTLNPDAGVSTGSSGNRVRFSGSSGAGAATGVSDEPAGAELTEQCSVLNPQLCECEDTKIPGVEMCFAPTQVVSLKD